MKLLSWIIAAGAWSIVHQRYAHYRQQGVSAITAWLHCWWVILSWSLLRLESPAWQRLRDRRREFFPHLSPDRPCPADFFRYFLQGLWLILIRPATGRHPRRMLPTLFLRWRQRGNSWLEGVSQKAENWRQRTQLEQRWQQKPGILRNLLFGAGILFSALLALLCISQPFDLFTQSIFVLILWGVAMLVRRIPGRLPTIMMIVLSLTISCRYLWWRYTSTLNWDDPLSLTFGLLLIAAETYSWVVLVLGYLQTLWPLQRQPIPMPRQTDDWPTIDLLVPTCNEPLRVVKPALYAALGLDWPAEKITIYLLDDGDRTDFRQFAAEIGVQYIARSSHEDAKAGNINHALYSQCRSEYVAIFDCDHVPTRSFLQMTMGWFLRDPKLAMLQTPHCFFSPDPFERNLGRFRRTPDEGALFYGLVQDGNDVWNAAFFCGSCAVMRRSALDQVGGIAIGTVTEDAHTSLRLHRQGYTSAYIRIPQAAGLATESLTAHIGQRIRWARGMVQIFRLDNPLWGKGLKLTQRLCYANAMLHFLAGIPRLIFLLAPLAFLLCHAYIIFAPALAIAIFVLPHMLHTSLTNSRIQGRWRHSFWSEVYETVLAWYIARPTTVALFNPRKGRFNVTAKGGLVTEQHLDWVVTKPYLLLVFLNLLGLIAACWRLYAGPSDEHMTVLVSLIWVVYNMIILGGAVAVAVEARQRREAHRVDITMPAVLGRENGHMLPCTLRDYSDGGVGVELRQQGELHENEKVFLMLRRGRQEFSFPGRVQRTFARHAGIRLEAFTTAQHVEFIQCTFARADAWALQQDNIPQDRPIQSLADIIRLGFQGYVSLIEYGPPPLRSFFVVATRLLNWIASFLPGKVSQSGSVSS